jgi:tRNA nucleotidyltransferase (CCA-adding enzyme)
MLPSPPLPDSSRSRVEKIAAVARDLGVPAYLVGGFVRDLLLGRESRDLDVVVEGDGIELATRLAVAVGGQARVHPAFRTAVVVDPEGFAVDVATARSELYRAPAALPEVQAADLRQDLLRRDFTVNTLAIGLGAESEVIDFFEGWRDLAAKTLRVLHDRSFIDDPTRVLRGVRLELRLGFRMSPETVDLAEAAVVERVFDHLSGSRLRAELTLLLGDPSLVLAGLERLAGLGVLRAIDPRLALDATTRERLHAVHAALGEKAAGPPLEAWRLFFMALSAGLDEDERERLADRLLLAGEDRLLMVGFPDRLDSARQVLRGEPKPHQVAEALEPLAGEELLLLMAEGEETVRGWIGRYLAELRALGPSLRGADLLAAGVPAGARVGEALRATRRARLDGRIDAAGELRYALTFLEGDA